MALAELAWQSSGTRSRVIYDEGAPVGAGRQATVVRVLELDGQRVQDWFLKIYFDQRPIAKQRAVSFAAYVAANHLQWGGLLGLPREAFEFADGSGRVGYLMHRVPGRDMDSTTLFAWLRTQPLAKRLGLAWQLADSVARLHEARVIHGDINDSNIILDDAGGHAFLVDADGGGVLQDGSSENFKPNLFPVIRGKESTMAPELLVDPSRFPTKCSDDYSLAVMIHRILLPFGRAGIHPFFFLRAARQVADPKLNWPPDLQSCPGQGAQIERHRELLKALGDRLAAMFAVTFGVGRVANPRLRPGAREWSAVLETMSRWTYRCDQPSCGKEFVAYERAECPFCGTRVAHGWVETPAARIPINQDLALLSRDVGFTDGNYEVAVVKRSGDRVVLEPKVGNPPPRPVSASPGRAAKLKLPSLSGATQVTLRIVA